MMPWSDIAGTEAPPDAVQIHVEDLVEGRIVEIGEIAPAGNSRVGDDNMQTAEFAYGARHQRVDGEMERLQIAFRILEELVARDVLGALAQHLDPAAAGIDLRAGRIRHGHHE